jgi:signal transduction histidine kinase
MIERLSRQDADSELIQNMEAIVDVIAVSGRVRYSDLRGGFWEHEEGLQMAAHIPIQSGAEPVGEMIFAWTHPRKLTKRELDICETAAWLVGMELRQAGLVTRASEGAALRERARLAREIHDSVTQTVTAAVLNIEAADRAMENDPAQARDALAIAKQLGRESLVALRRSIWDLRAALQQGKTFESVLNEACAPLRAAGVHCAIEVRGTSEGTSAEQRAAAVSVAKEALTNVLRHANASTVEVVVNFAPGGLMLTVTDDGDGMATPIPETSFGILGMRERATSAGGDLRLSSYPGHGTRVEVQFPNA